jgi:nicotinamidase-related amidase
MQAYTKVGLDALLTPDNCVVVMIDHQPFQLANVNSHEPTMVINNAIGLAMTAKAYGIPTILTTVNEDTGGQIFKGVQDIFPDHKTINRTYINAWEDQRVVEAVKKTGRRKAVFAALWTEMCLAMPAIHAMGDGYDVYVVTDASAGVSVEAHDMGIASLPRAPSRSLGSRGRRTSARLGAHPVSRRPRQDLRRTRRRHRFGDRLGNAAAPRQQSQGRLGHNPHWRPYNEGPNSSGSRQRANP